MTAATERLFYRAQILANAEVIFPSHNPKLITTEENPGGLRRICLISSTTGEILLDGDIVDHGMPFKNLYERTKRLLAEMVKKGLKGDGSAATGAGGVGGLPEKGGSFETKEDELKKENEALRRENEVLKMQLIQQKFDMMDAKLAEETRRREELEKRVTVLEESRQGTDTPSTWNQLSVGLHG
ncbi:hypothetical protein K440DRAFT_625536 [Wilcoxina mikolae CBS 423.85]|nr:hypothetical protein K440DRAFT_625536 [Wilcoxina mikolae CBS 423.85]